MNINIIEEWKPVLGYEGIYEVSNLGRVKSLGRMIRGNGNSMYWHKERIMQPQSNRKGYHNIILSKDGTGKTCTLHRIVASAFIPNPNNYPEINHINENKKDNRVTNLEWCTSAHNHNWGMRNKRAGAANSKPLIAIRFSDGKEFYFKSKLDALKQGFHPTQISMSNVTRYVGKTWQGIDNEFYWKYADDVNPMPKTIDVRHAVLGISIFGDINIKFVSLHDAQRNGYYRNSIKKSIRTGRPYKGYKWQQIL